MARVRPASWGRHPAAPWLRNRGQGVLCALCVAAGVLLSARMSHDQPAQAGLRTTDGPPAAAGRSGVTSPTPAPTMPPGGYPQVVASHDLAATTVISGPAVVTSSFAVATGPIPPRRGTFPSLQALDAYIATAPGGRYLTRAVPAGAPLSQRDLGDLGGRAAVSLSLSLPEGFEAISVNVPPLQSADGTVVAGDHVDVLLTLSTDQLVNSRSPGQSPGPQKT